MGNLKKITKRWLIALIIMVLAGGCLWTDPLTVRAQENGSKKTKVACVGDSLTEGYQSSNGLKSSTAYPAVLQNLLGEDYEVGNFGKTSYTLMKNTNKSYWNSAEYANSKVYDADVVIIMLGTNDSKAVYWNEAKFKEDAIALVESYENLENSPQVIFAVSPQCYVTTGTDITKASVDRLCQVQRALIEEQQWESLDMYELTADREDFYHKDRVHFTDEGYAYIAQCVYEKITGEKVHSEGFVKIPHTQTGGTDNYFTFAAGKWTKGDEVGYTHTWSNVLDSNDPRSTWYEVHFSGNKIDIYSGKNYMMGKVEYFVDGRSYGIFDLYNAKNINSTLITTISDLEEGAHIFRAEATGERNSSGRGNMAIDAAEVIVYSENLRIETPGADIYRMFRNETDPGNNSWVFTGGEAVQGTFAQLGGARNYIGHFEEYARSQKSAGDDLTRQRYTINTAKAGQQLSQIIENWEQKVSKFDPRAVAYMVGVEDYKQGMPHVEEFKRSLEQFIENALQEKKNQGSFAVIQKPFAVWDDEENALIELYCAAVDEVVGSYQETPEKYKNIVVIDHYSQTKNFVDFKQKDLNEDGSLNELGHVEIGRQFVAAVMGMTDAYPCTQGISMGKKTEEAPRDYLDLMPEVLSGKDSLKVTIRGTEETSWKYEVVIGKMQISGKAEGPVFEIKNLPENEDYVLKIRTEDGKSQLVTMKGVIKDGNTGVKDQQVLNANQQRLAKLMETKDSLTWLFMGDSITHGLVYTYGYGASAQMFEKFLKDDLGRTDDVVINTAVSGAHTVSTLNNIEQRMKKYVPDVVAIMLGTNDPYPDPKNIDPALPMTADAYEANMKNLIAQIKAVNPNAVILLRSPTPMTSDDGRKAGVLLNIERMKKIAEEDEHLIYVDQYTEMYDMLAEYSWLGNAQQNFLGNWLHPGVNGQLMMTRQLIKACGLWSEDCAITNLYYQGAVSKTSSSVVPELIIDSQSIGTDRKQLADLTGFQIGKVTLKAANEMQMYTIEAETGDAQILLSGLPGGTYEVKVSAMLTDEAKEVEFAKQTVTIEGVQKPEEPETPIVPIEPEQPEAGAVTEKFTDIEVGKWYVDAVQYVYENQLMNGYDGKFTPDASMTRAMLVTTLYRMAGEPEVTDDQSYLQFSDMKKGDWYQEAVAWALNENIATGDPVANKFHPNERVTREQLAAFLYRYTIYQGGSVDESSDFGNFANADMVSVWALKEMKWAVGKGLISGLAQVGADNVITGYDLAPKGSATRAQMAMILQRYCRNS